MIGEFKEAVDDGNEFSALLTDLSKAFDLITHYYSQNFIGVEYHIHRVS